MVIIEEIRRKGGRIGAKNIKSVNMGIHEKAKLT
jgi:hypothetical protein